MYTTNHACPARIWAGLLGKWKTVEIPYVSASAHLGQRKRLAQKETVRRDPSKTIGKTSKITVSAGLERKRLTAGADGAAWDCHGSSSGNLETPWENEGSH